MISLFYLGLLSFLYVKISLDTIGMRRKYKISLGQGANDEIAGYVAAHSNFQAYVPILFILAFAAEQSNLIPSILVHGVWLLILFGRVFHYLGIRDAENPNFKFRVIGMQSTIWPLIVLAAFHVVRYLLALGARV